MSIQERLSTDLKTAMREKNEPRRSTIRFIRAAIQNEEKEKRRPLEDENVIIVLSRMVRQHQESITGFGMANRLDLVKKEESELAIVREYLPEQISDEELDSLVRNAICEADAKQQADMGKVMKILMPKVQGKADGSRVSSLVKDLLTK
ncbi:MAG: hypothetical protein DK304_000961 [Chloroflexi bacterium]|jgi:uncharacterized protein YqeY|nr:MAG: hypothetical protein DK304_000961 [Chloroflexota bacterium]